MLVKNFFGWKLHFSDDMVVIRDESQRSVVALNKKEEEEIHVIISVNDQGELSLKPSWNVKFLIKDDRTVYIDQKNIN